MSNYTKGPWIAKGPDIYAQDGTRIASCGITRNYAENAKLLSAAPELLEALCRAIPFVEDHEGHGAYKPGAVSAAVREMKAVITKAGG